MDTFFASNRLIYLTLFGDIVNFHNLVMPKFHGGFGYLLALSNHLLIFGSVIAKFVCLIKGHRFSSPRYRALVKQIVLVP